MTLFQKESGPLVYYTGQTLGVEELGRGRWKITRAEMLRFGLKCIIAALRRAA